jgi:hypothetical protein
MPYDETAQITYGSGWMVQILSTKATTTNYKNPTHGSGWIVQILSTQDD